MEKAKGVCLWYRSGLVILCLAAVVVAGPARAQDLLSKYESVERPFERMEIADKTVYFHQRMIDDAIVEKDYIVYQFDRATKQLLARKSHWRDDLPEHLPPGLMTREAAESMAEGDVLWARLYVISPESDVFPLVPTPHNPCWVVRSLDGGRMVITVIDAVEQSKLGYGIPPPYTAFSFTGPWECPYYGAWTAWYQNAESWFNTMGYVTEGVKWATKAQIRGHVKSDSTAMFYELNHGGSTSFQYGCDNGSFLSVASWQVASWITDYAKMPFTFLGSCEGICDTSSVSFSYAFRKGSAESTTTVGYCHMADIQCEVCWNFSIDWQDALFNYMNLGWTVKDALDQANADYPSCGNNQCMRFAGDENFAVVPVVERDPWPPLVTVGSPNGGEVLQHGTDYQIEWVATDNARVTSITILLSTDSGLTFPDTIATGEVNDSSYLWPVPDIDSKTARIKVVAVDGALHEGTDISDADFTLWGTISGVEVADMRATPDQVVLAVTGNSPIGSESRIEFGLPVSSHVRLDVYDVTGRLVANLVNDYACEGYHAIRWHGETGSGTQAGPGIYFVRLRSEEGTQAAKAVIAR